MPICSGVQCDREASHTVSHPWLARTLNVCVRCCDQITHNLRQAPGLPHVRPIDSPAPAHPVARPEPLRFDVRATVEDDNVGMDGAYDLIMDCATAKDIIVALAGVLSSPPQEWLMNATGRVSIRIHIGAAGTGDHLPI